VSGPSLLLVSPEQLKSKPFELILHNAVFTSRLCLLVVDEMHLVLDWGTGFRVAFKHIGTTLARMPETTCLLGVTATLPAIDAHTLAEALGLTRGSFHFSRRSNLRTDVRMEFREQAHGLSGWDFPDLRWIIEGNRKTVIYCDTISLAFRLFVYYWCCISDCDSARRRLRLYTSIFHSDYNAETRLLFVNDAHMQIIISTDALKVGNDFPNVADAVILNSERISATVAG
jgi:superfamily II DNA helicase RecQ